MRSVSATDAARNFSGLLDEVESGGESFLVLRRGRAVARIEPAPAATGAAVKELLRKHSPDPDWERELRELRVSLPAGESPWNE